MDDKICFLLLNAGGWPFLFAYTAVFVSGFDVSVYIESCLNFCSSQVVYLISVECYNWLLVLGFEHGGFRTVPTVPKS